VKVSKKTGELKFVRAGAEEKEEKGGEINEEEESAV
jgi:hypothetical protein